MRTFELTSEGLEWRLTSCEPGADHPSTKFVKAYDLRSVEKWSGSLGGSKVEHGLLLEINRDTSGQTFQVVYIDTISDRVQQQWYRALHYILDRGDTPGAQDEIEFTRNCKPRGVELGRNRVAQFALQGKHGKLLIRSVLERARLDFDPEAVGNQQLRPGLQIRMRGTAVGEKLPPVPTVSYLNLDEHQRRLALTTFFLRQEADNLVLLPHLSCYGCTKA
eukprot:COSAG02_NODE_1057_length_14906_cov_79.739853_4_plen_220_part_00